MEFTVVEPGFEFFEPPTPDKYLEFLERCTRVCYKSEEHIKEGSAEKLMSKVVKEYEHYSVTEHLRLAIELPNTERNWSYLGIVRAANPLMVASHFDRLVISGNARMWKDLFKRTNVRSEIIWGIMEANLNSVLPLLFDATFKVSEPLLIDTNPITNANKLDKWHLLKHTSLTVKIIGDRSMSHQLVRHRLGAYSQESQRYCNYGKKGGQYIVPPSIKAASEAVQFAWHEQVKCSFKLYEGMLREGVAPEDARSILPNATKTEVVTTYTLENWKHIFEHRAHNPKAQWQIREIMLGVEKKFHELLPEIF